MEVRTNEVLNHVNFSSWVNLLKIAARRDKIITRNELKKFTSTPLEEELLNFMTKLVLHPTRFPDNPNYYLVGQKGDRVVLAGFLTTKDTISAPAPENLSSRHTAFVFELWKKEEKWKFEERTVITIVDGRLEIIGNLNKILPFIYTRR